MARLVLTELLVKKLTTTTKKCGANELLKPKQKFTECINDLRKKKSRTKKILSLFQRWTFLPARN